MGWYDQFRKQGWAITAFKWSLAIAVLGFAFFLVVLFFSPPYVGFREFAIVFVVAVFGPLVLVNASTLLLWLTAQLTPGYQRRVVILAPQGFWRASCTRAHGNIPARGCKSCCSRTLCSSSSRQPLLRLGG